MIELTPTAGLGNRMRTIASGLSLFKKSDHRLKIHWIKDDEVGCRFDELFSPFTNEKISVVEHNRIPLKLRSARANNKLLLPFKPIVLTFQNVLFDINLKGREVHDFISQNGADELLKKNRIQIQTTNAFHRHEDYYALFVPLSELRDQIELNTKGFDENTIGIHIRQKDFRYKHLAPISLFKRIMEQALAKNDATTFFLASDSESVKEELSKSFGDRILTSQKKVSRITRRGMQEALIDLYTLSSACKVFGPFESSFSRTAAYIGNIDFYSVNSNY